MTRSQFATCVALHDSTVDIHGAVRLTVLVWRRAASHPTLNGHRHCELLFIKYVLTFLVVLWATRPFRVLGSPYVYNHCGSDCGFVCNCLVLNCD